MEAVRWFLVSMLALGLGGCDDLKKDTPIVTTLPPIVIDEQIPYENLSIDELVDLNRGDVEIIRDPATDMPKQINGVFTTQAILSPEDALSALLSVRGIMGIEHPYFTCTDIDDSRENLRVFALEQLHDGLSVFGGGFRVIATKTGKSVSVRGTFQRGIDIETTPALDAKDACKKIDLKSGQKIEKVQLIVFTSPNSEPRLSWDILVSARNPLEEKVVFIDALTGDVLAEYPLAID